MEDKDTSLNGASELKNIQNNYFVRMMLPDAELKAEPYVYEESKLLQDLLSSTNSLDTYNFVVVGSGTLWYIDMAYGRVKNYVAIEPLADIFIQKQVSYILTKHKDIHIIGQDFGNFNSNELPNNKSIFIFHFNILSYIPDPIEKINSYIKEGDILYLSTWNSTNEAKTVRKSYFDFINIGMNPDEFRIDPLKPIGLCNLDVFPFEKLKYYKSHKRVKGNITDILIINC